MKRIVYISSYAAVVTPSRIWEDGVVWTSADWNPVTYDEGVHGPPINAYRVGKKLAERAAWACVQDEHHPPHFDLVTLCPPLVFGPVVHPVARVEDLNDSNIRLWRVADGQYPFPPAVSSVYVDVRDVAFAIAEALLRPEVSNTRFIIAAPEPFSLQRMANILRETFDWAKDVVAEGNPDDLGPVGSRGDSETARQKLGIQQYRSFRETIVDSIGQFKEIQLRQSKV